MLRLMFVLATLLFANAVKADGAKTQYFGAKCLAAVKSALDNPISKDNRKITGEVIFKDFKKAALKDELDYSYCDYNADRCAASYSGCLYYSTNRPWGEIENHYTECLFDRNGEIVNKWPIYIGSRDSGRARRCLTSMWNKY